ncbi:MAG: heavy metal-responsive transcriptional regulator [Thiomonas delicata]
MNALTIGKLARSMGLATETLRHYERLGLIYPSQRSAANYRLYGDEAGQRLRFIRRAQALGFSLPEIRELLSLHADADADMGRVKAIVQQRMAQIDARMADLQQLKAGLMALASSCPGHGATQDCPILAALTREPQA